MASDVKKIIKFLVCCKRMHSVLWHCWLGGRKGIRPVKNWVVGCWRGYLSGARCRLAYGPVMPLPLTVSCFSKIQIGFTFLVPAHPGIVPNKGPLNGCVCAKEFTGLDWTNYYNHLTSEWQWHQLGHMQVCASLQTDNHDSTPPLYFLQAGCASCHPTNSVKALMAIWTVWKKSRGNRLMHGK